MENASAGSKSCIPSFRCFKIVRQNYERFLKFLGKFTTAKAMKCFAVAKDYSVYSWSERTWIVSFCKASMASTTETAPDIVV